MASYTMELKEYLEMWSQDNPDTKTRDVIETGRTKLFDFDYPLFDPNYKKVFETHFIRNFYMREIGFETEELFKFNLETWLIINMPYFNKLFESELIEYDPLINSKVDVTANKENTKERADIRDIIEDTKEDGTKDTTAHQTGSTDSDTTSHQTGSIDSDSTSSQDGSIIDDDFNRKIDSDNPDSRLNLTSNDGEGVIEYASSIEENNANNKRTTSQDGTGSEHSDSQSDATGSEHSESVSDGTGHETTSETGNLTKNDTLESSIDETEDYIQHRVGKIGVVSYPKLVTDYRNAFLRIEKDIFKEMQQLFMLVY